MTLTGANMRACDHPMTASAFRFRTSPKQYVQILHKLPADKLAEHQYDQFQARRLTAEAGDDTKAFDEAVKKTPAKKPRRKKS